MKRLRRMQRMKRMTRMGKEQMCEGKTKEEASHVSRTKWEAKRIQHYFETNLAVFQRFFS